jgi:hypothetical protein
MRAPHLAHAAAAQQLDQAITPERRAHARARRGVACGRLVHHTITPQPRRGEIPSGVKYAVAKPKPRAKRSALHGPGQACTNMEP